jgi:hypothetical protein
MIVPAAGDAAEVQVLLPPYDPGTLHNTNHTNFNEN